MPLHKLQIRWKEPRTGTMGTLLEAQRIAPLLPDSYILAGQELLSKAASLFPDGVDHGYHEMLQAFQTLSQQDESVGIVTAIWQLLESSGWVSDFEHCWHCSEAVELNTSMYWHQAHLLCPSCARHKGVVISIGFRKTLIFSIHQKNIKYQESYLQTWKKMTSDIFKLHQENYN